MKKVIVIIGLFTFMTNMLSLTFAQGTNTGPCVKLNINGEEIDYCGYTQCQDEYENRGKTPADNSLRTAYEQCHILHETCPVDQILNNQCCEGTVMEDENGNNQCIKNTAGTAGINCNQRDLINGQCSFNVYETLNIRKENKDASVGLFIQDIILGATFFIGTVITIAIVVAGLLYVFAGARGNENLQKTAKNGLKNAFIGLILVSFAYGIIRLVQFIASGG